MYNLKAFVEKILGDKKNTNIVWRPRWTTRLLHVRQAPAHAVNFTCCQLTATLWLSLVTRLIVLIVLRQMMAEIFCHALVYSNNVGKCGNFVGFVLQGR